MNTLPKRVLLNQKGQALLVILLVMSVALTTVLSIVARSVTDISISKTEDNSIRAFNAAEAGIENALVGSVGSGSFPESGATYDTSVSEPTVGSTYLYPKALAAGEQAVFWFVSHTVVDGEEKITCQDGVLCYVPKSNVFLDLCWGEEGTSKSQPTTPAVEAEFYYEPATVSPPAWDNSTNPDYSLIRVARAGYDPAIATRDPSSNFADVSNGHCNIEGKQMQFHKKIYFTGGGGEGDLGLSSWDSYIPGALVMVRVRMLYNSDQPQPIGLRIPSSGVKMPAQGRVIESTGVSGTANRKLELFQGYAEPPFVFDSAIFSGSSISK